MSVLSPAPVSTDRFLWQPEHRLLTAEISDLGRDFNFGRVFDDACDEGLTIVSHHTDREVVYAVNHTEHDREGDLLYWDLRPASRRDAALPTVRIFND